MIYFCFGLLLGISMTALIFLVIFKSSKKNLIKNNQQKIADLVNVIEEKYQKQIEAKTKEVNLLKTQITEISEDYHQKLITETSLLQKQYTQEIEQKNQTINELKQLVNQLEKSELERVVIEETYQKQIEAKSNEVNLLKTQITEISEDYHQKLITETSLLQKQYTQEIEAKSNEVNLLKTQITEISEDYHQNLIAETSLLQKQYSQEIEQKNQNINELTQLVNQLQKSELEKNLNTAVDLNNKIVPIFNKSSYLLPDDYLEKFPKKYFNLKKHLLNKEWQNADKETVKIIFELTNQQNSHLTVADYQSIPLQDLVIINYLWTYYSQNIFGLSSQYQIYLSIDKSKSIELEKWQWRKIGDLLGWRKSNEWVLNPSQLINSLDAMKGQFPFLIYWQGVWLGGFMDGQGDRFLALMNRFSDALK